MSISNSNPRSFDSFNFSFENYVNISRCISLDNSFTFQTAFCFVYVSRKTIIFKARMNAQKIILYQLFFLNINISYCHPAIYLQPNDVYLTYATEFLILSEMHLKV